MENVSDITLYKNLQKLLTKANIYSVFQPIISLKDASILGYEVLIRDISNLMSPQELINSAIKYDKIIQLESLFIKKALENSSKNEIKEKLFINISPLFLHKKELFNELVINFSKENSIGLGDIILEVTEQENIYSDDIFKQNIEYYKYKHYKIAIDDLGSEHSSLNRISVIKPEFIKLDMHLIRNIHKDEIKQAIVKSMCQLANSIGSYIIAEGIESEHELQKLIDLDVHYGQGYYLQKPAEKLFPLKDDIYKKIINFNIINSNRPSYTITTLSTPSKTITSNILVSKVDEEFKKNTKLLSMCLVDNDIVKGTVTRNSFYTKLGSMYGYSLYSFKPISAIMNKTFLSVDCDMSIEKVIHLAMSRPNDSLYDHVTILKDSKYFGTVTIKNLLEKTIEIEINNARHLNPLTGLPGNLLIEQNLECLINSNAPYSILYFDIDNFKAYNDVYGFENGDRIIYGLSEIICNNIPKDSFIGHIGGDDFIAIISSYYVESICEDIISSFDSNITMWYSQHDINNQYIIATNRHGFKEKFSLASISIAVVTNKHNIFSSIFDLAKEASEIKKKCKQIPRSSYLIL